MQMETEFCQHKGDKLHHNIIINQISKKIGKLNGNAKSIEYQIIQILNLNTMRNSRHTVKYRKIPKQRHVSIRYNQNAWFDIHTHTIYIHIYTHTHI